jgi:hypothetical protein
VNNALATLLAETQLLGSSGRVQHAEDLESLGQIAAMTRRIRDSLERLTRLTSVPVKDYVPGVSMVDLERAKVRPS